MPHILRRGWDDLCDIRLAGSSNPMMFRHRTTRSGSRRFSAGLDAPPISVRSIFTWARSHHSRPEVRNVSCARGSALEAQWQYRPAACINWTYTGDHTIIYDNSECLHDMRVALPDTILKKA